MSESEAPSSSAAPAGDVDAEHRPSPGARILLWLLSAYRWTAVLRTPRCRFYPSCSTYAVTAVGRHGALRGAGLAIRRVGRCHPWNPGGVDHVPARK